MANRNFANAGRVFQMHCAPVELDCNFIVDNTNGNGLGIRSLKGPCIANVFMNTSVSPGTGNNGVVNPNPHDGYIMVQLNDNYNRYYGGAYGFVSPVVNPNTAVTSGLSLSQIYVITSVGTTTLAEWQAIGLPKGFTPAVGQAFVSIATGTGGSHTGKVGVPATAGSGIESIEVVGDPNTQIAANPATAPAGTGSLLFLQCLAPTSAGVTTKIATKPADGTVIGLRFYLSNSSIQVQGE